MSDLMTSRYRYDGGRRPSASLVRLPESARVIALCSMPMTQDDPTVPGSSTVALDVSNAA